MPGPADRQDRSEAARMFVAVALAVAVLIAVGIAALVLAGGPLSQWVDATFGTGLGLKEAALIAFGVAFVSIVVLTIVSGGDAILGELPFTIVGFFLFFLFCWLMLAWIF